MPQSAFRTFIGVAKDTINGNLGSNVAAAATTLPLVNVLGSPATAMTATIFDGPLTEQVACTGFTGGNATVAATANAHSANVYVSFQLTASAGPTAYIRAKKIQFTDNYNNTLYDTGFEGSQAAVFGAQQGLRIANISLGGDIFASDFGYILGSFFGAYDYTGTTGGNPTKYAFSPANTGNGQPPSYIFYDYDPSGIPPGGGGPGALRAYAKAVVSDLGISLDPGTLSGWTATAMAFASGIVATPATVPPVFDTFRPVPARYGLVTAGGTITQKVLTAEYTFKRNEFGSIPTLQGIQDPLAIFSGPVNLSTKIALVKDDDTQYLAYINQTQPTFLLSCVQGTGTGANGFVIQNTKANYEGFQLGQDSGSYVKLDGNFTAIANTTDASTAGGGKSPALVTLSTGTATGSTLY